MKWIETTLRKGTKTPKICRDMFIADSFGSFTLVVVKNGRISIRKAITTHEAIVYQRENDLRSVKSIFTNCRTFRTPESNKLIASILRNNHDNIRKF